MVNRPIQDNLLIISGSGRRSGKTTLVCEIIRHFSKFNPLIALKISPHANHSAGLANLLIEKNGFRFYEETIPNGKDSGLFLESGAKHSYFLEVTDHNIDIAWEFLAGSFLKTDEPIICESGYLGHLLKPSLMIFSGPDNPMITPSKQLSKALSDLVVVPGNYDVGKLARQIFYTDGKWSYQPDQSESQG